MRVLTELIDLVLPADCLCCGRPGTAWCAACQPSSIPRRVEHAGAPPTIAAGEYAEQLRTVLIGYKERGCRQVAGRLADYLTDAVDEASRLGGAVARPVLVPVPSRPAAARSRGGDHVLRLAGLVARQTQLPLVRALALTGSVRDSANLTTEQRRANLAGRMTAAAPAGLGGLRPIVLDDIVTTGATLAEAGRALAVAGWPPAAAAVVAATRLRRPPATPTPRSPDPRAPPW
ncbi:MAG TPA: ComF family protein [Jatrophihabitans sp.]|nr:ComF family protein [Jatrophihabitans sp.]